MFGTLGGPELFLIFVVALIVFGPRKLPEIGKSLGRMMSEFRRASNDFRSTIESEVEAEKIRDSMRIEAPKASSPAKDPPPPAAPTGESAEGPTPGAKEASADPADASLSAASEEPAAPRATEEPAAPRPTEEPAAPRPTEEPAAPRPTEERAAPPDTVSREPSSSPIEPK